MTMANHCRLGSAAAIAACNAIVDLIDTGGAGSVFIYTGSEPAYADDAGSLTEVATCALAATAYGAASADSTNKWAEANLTESAVDSDATGSESAVTCFRIKNGAGTTVLQGTVGTSGADLNMPTTIGAGAQVTITALEVRVPYNQA
jgi:hypothetical protein